MSSDPPGAFLRDVPFDRSPEEETARATARRMEEWRRDGTKRKADRYVAADGGPPRPEPEGGGSVHPLGGACTPAHPPGIAGNPDILGAFWGVLRVCGVVGEKRNAKLTFLALTSRLLKEPVSIVIKGLSASGKSYTTEQTVKFFPPEAVVQFTAMSERALVYTKEEFAHRTIILYEATALREQREKTEGNQTAYFIRSLLSEGRINYSVTIRDKKEGWVTREIVKEGPTNIIITTTALSLHGENETRMLSLSTNDTADQTKAIMLQMAAGAAYEVDYSDWHDLQRWLATAERRVVIPFARFLAEQIPPVAVRLRRDFRSILRLIETHAFLHQISRDRDAQGQVIATVSDYAVVRELIVDLISAGVGAAVPETVRQTVNVVRRLDQGGDGVKVEAVAKALDIDRSAAQRRLATARDKGFLANAEEKRGKSARYIIGEPLPDEIQIMPTVEGVHAHLDAAHTLAHTPKPPADKQKEEVCAAVQGVQRVCNGGEAAEPRCEHCGEPGGLLETHTASRPVARLHRDCIDAWVER